MRPALQIADRARFSADLQRIYEQQDYEKWAVASIDVRRFSLFNVWYGKEAGDKVLSDLSQVLLDLRETKGYPVGYLGDDDFLICLPNDEQIITEVYDSLQKCMDTQGILMKFYVSMGVCPAVQHLKCSPFTLYNYARIAAAESPYRGGRHIHYFDENVLHELENFHRLGSEINRAFDHNEFVMYLQPKQNSISGRIIGFEALARWNHPTRGILEPDIFMDVLEQSGKAPRLDLDIWHQACSILARWKHEGRNIVPISVNLSYKDIEAFDVVEAFLSLIETYDIDPKLLEIEVTESILIRARERVGKVVKNLRSKGFVVLIDDFGSGYSSLGMLKDIQVDVLKLDMSLIDFSEENYKRGINILRSVVHMSHQLNVPLIAEGVHTIGQISILQSMDCLYVQGFYFHESLPVQEAEKLLLTKGTPEYWDIKKDYANRTVNELGDITGNDSSALALRSFRIYSDNLLFNALLNLETGIFNIIHCSPKLVRSELSTNDGYSAYCKEVLARKLIFPEDLSRLYEILPLDKLREHFYVSHDAYSFRYRELTHDGYEWNTADIIPAADCSPQNAWISMSIRKDYLAEQLASELDELYTHDMQTGALNRNKYEQDIVKLAQADCDHIAVAYFDANGLHEINNTQGHAAGDAFLQAIVDVLTKHFGKDYVYRIGGDEFVVILPDGNLEELRKSIKELKLELAEHSYEVAAGSCLAQTPADLSQALTDAETSMRLEKYTSHACRGAHLPQKAASLPESE